jgi:hypothetical protein
MIESERLGTCLDTRSRRTPTPPEPFMGLEMQSVLLQNKKRLGCAEGSEQPGYSDTVI